MQKESGFPLRVTFTCEYRELNYTVFTDPEEFKTHYPYIPAGLQDGVIHCSGHQDIILDGTTSQLLVQCPQCGTPYEVQLCFVQRKHTEELPDTYPVFTRAMRFFELYARDPAENAVRYTWSTEAPPSTTSEPLEADDLELQPGDAVALIFAYARLTTFMWPSELEFTRKQPTLLLREAPFVRGAVPTLIGVKNLTSGYGLRLKHELYGPSHDEEFRFLKPEHFRRNQAKEVPWIRRMFQMKRTS